MDPFFCRVARCCCSENNKKYVAALAALAEMNFEDPEETVVEEKAEGEGGMAAESADAPADGRTRLPPLKK